MVGVQSGKQKDAPTLRTFRCLLLLPIMHSQPTRAFAHFAIRLPPDCTISTAVSSMFVHHRNTLANCFTWSIIHRKVHNAVATSQEPRIFPRLQQPTPMAPSSLPMSCVRYIKARISLQTERSSPIAVSVSDQPTRALSSPSCSGIHMSATTTVPGQNGGVSYVLPSRSPNQLRLSRLAACRRDAGATLLSVMVDCMHE